MSTPQFSSSGGSAGQVQPKSSSPRSSSGGVFTRKVGPLPMWAWMGIALAIALAYYLIRKHSSSSSASTSNTPDNTTAAGQVPQFVNETNVTAPPSTPAPIVTPNTPAPATGPQPIQGVPNLVGMTRATAESTLKNAGVEIQYDLSKGQKLLPKTSYIVTSQNPPAGAQVQPGQKIQVHVETASAYKKAGKKEVY